MVCCCFWYGFVPDVRESRRGQVEHEDVYQKRETKDEDDDVDEDVDEGVGENKQNKDGKEEGTNKENEGNNGEENDENKIGKNIVCGSLSASGPS